MFYTRTEVATKLGVTYAGVNYLIRARKIRPRAAAPTAVMTFDADEINEYAQRRKTHGRKIGKPMPALRLELSGELCARVFELLDADTHPIAIVREVKAHPDAVMNLVERYQKLKSAGSELEPARCVKCGTSTARFCGGCLNKSASSPPSQLDDAIAED